MRRMPMRVAPAGTPGTDGVGEALPCVTPMTTWLSASPWVGSLALIQMQSMRGWLPVALTAGVWPPAQYASVYPSASPREHTAMPAPTL